MSVQGAAPFIERDETFLDVNREHFELLCPVLLTFSDFGLVCEPGKSDFLSYHVFNGVMCCGVSILRTHAADDDAILVQLVSSRYPPVIGQTAFVSAPCEMLAEAESRVARAAFQILETNMRGGKC